MAQISQGVGFVLLKGCSLERARKRKMGEIAKMVLYGGLMGFDGLGFWHDYFHALKINNLRTQS